MYCIYQTVLHKETKKLWVIMEVNYCMRTRSLVVSMMNEAGAIHEFSDVENQFTCVCDEFGCPLPGLLLVEHNKVIGPDVSLYQYVNMTEEERQRRQEIIIRAITEKYLQKIKDLINNTSERFINLFDIDYYKQNKVWESLYSHCDHVFQGRHVDHFKIYGVWFHRSQPRIIEKFAFNKESATQLFDLATLLIADCQG